MADTRINLQQLLRGKQLYRTLHGVYTEALVYLKAVLEQSAAKGETAKTTITAPPSIEKFREQRRQKRKLRGDDDTRAKKPTSNTGDKDPPTAVETSSYPDFFWPIEVN
jgi:hypothetical protein